jgi:formyl-CoA transferase
MAELDTLIADWSRGVDSDDLLARLHEAGVPAGRIYQAQDMFTDPHFAARQAIVSVPHPELGDLSMQNVFPKLSASPGAVRGVGPALGEHNDDIYRGLLGLGEAELARLASAGVI